MPQPPTWTFVQMTSEAADEIAAWRYPEPYGFYDLSNDADDLAEFMDEASWRIGDLSQRDTMLAVHREGVLHGFFSFAGSPDLCTIGLGLAPERTGRGLGASFVEAGLAFARERWASHASDSRSRASTRGRSRSTNGSVSLPNEPSSAKMWGVR